MAGFALWATLDLAGLAAAFLLSAALLPARGLAVRWMAVLLVFLGSVLTCLQALGLAGVLTRGTLAACALALFAGEAALARHVHARARARGSSEAPDFVSLLRSDLGTPLRLVREALSRREPLALAALPALAVLGAAAVSAWYLRTWAWDAVWYHVPVADLIIQDHTLWFDPGPRLPFAQGYAKHVELLTVWNVLLPGDNRLDGAAQLPFGALGVLALVRWARRIGASRPLALGCASLWLLAPPVFLQLGCTYNDVACGASFLAAWVFLTEPRFDGAERLLCAAALGLYAGCKFTGVFHLALLAPLLLGRTAASVLRASRAGALRARLVEVLGAILLLAWLGGVTYAMNWLRFKNPVYPMRAHLPLLGEVQGPTDPFVEWTRPFFQSPGSLRKLVSSWFEPFPSLWPDVRSGGFGPLFRWLLLPALSLCAPLLLLRRLWREAAAALLLFALALVVPDPSWPRYLLVAPGAGLMALALLHVALPWRPARAALSLGALFLGLAGLAQGLPPMGPFPSLLPQAMRASAAERATLQLVRWQWPEAASRLREGELRAGDVVAYDDSVEFYADLWTRDVRNRAVYAQHDEDAGGRRAPAPAAAADARYLARLASVHAVWAAVREGGRAARLLESAGAQALFECPVSAAVMYRLPRALQNR